MSLAENKENVSLEDLPLATKTALVESPLYKQFLEERLAEQVKVVKLAAGMDEAARYARLGACISPALKGPVPMSRPPGLRW